MRVLHTPVNIGNHPWGLSRAERTFGIRSDLVVNQTSWLGYPADKILDEETAGSFTRYLRRTTFGLTAALRYDVLHYYFGRSLIYREYPAKGSAFSWSDVRLARCLGRKIFFTLQGCDARIASESNRRNSVTMCGAGACTMYTKCVSQFDAQRQRFIEHILPLADRIFYLNPELGHYIPRASFLPYSNVSARDIAPTPPLNRRRPRILHAPSDDSIKGSHLIEAALSELRKSYDFEYVPVRNVPHAEAMRLYADCDLVIDQILAGWYGGFAVELMAMGKPVACYIRDEDLHFLPKDMRIALPLLRVHPSHLLEDLKRILAARDRWPEWGAAGRLFVLRWHDPQQIAAAMVAAYREPNSDFDIVGDI